MKFKESARSLVEKQLFQVCRRLEQTSPVLHQEWERAELFRQYLVETLEYIDNGMSPEEFTQKTCKFFAYSDDLTPLFYAEFAKFRSRLLLSIIDFQLGEDT